MTLNIFGWRRPAGEAALLGRRPELPRLAIPLYLLDFELGWFCATRNPITTGPGLERPVSGSQLMESWFVLGGLQFTLIRA